jgi:NTE family protein
VIPEEKKTLSLVSQGERVKTAFVLAGGGSFGAIQVGMMHALAANGVTPDMVVGSSVGALNGAYYAGDPTLKGVSQLETIWRGLRRADVFPLTLRTLLGFVWRRDFLISHDGIQKLIDDNLPYRNLQDAKLPVHIVTTDVVSGNSVVISMGRPTRRSSLPPLSRALSRRSTTRTCIWRTERSPRTPRSRSRLPKVRGA